MRRQRAVVRGWLLALTLAACACAGAAGAATLTKQEYLAERNRAQASYKLAWDSCRKLRDNARDICKVEAKSGYQVAKAELQAQYQPTPKRDDAVKLARAKAAYSLAWEKCDDLRAGAKIVCQKDAKSSLVTAQQGVRLSRASVDKGVNSRTATSERKKLVKLEGAAAVAERNRP